MFSYVAIFCYYLIPQYFTDTYRVPFHSTKTTLNFIMDTFTTSIKRKYQERLVSREKQWPPCHSNKLVRLELVERERGEGYSANEQRGMKDERGRKDKDVKRTPLSYGDLLKVESGRKPVRKVLVEGDAGIGKTTLSISVSEDWANGKLFQQFELVLLLPLRHKEIAAVGSIPELLNLLHSSRKLCSSVADSLEEMEGMKVLIIADGWDELTESGRLECSFLYRLIFGELLPFVSVILTSRPSASAPLHQLPCIDRFVEVRGFDRGNIIKYIQSEFANDQEKASHLLEQLENNPLVESVCSVPLSCAIVCHLWRTLEEALPTTMTELYTKIILNVILRNIQKKDEFKHIDSLPDFNALPKELQQSWALLCKFAFEAIVKDTIVFSQEELADIFPHGLEDVLCFGLLQTAKTILETGYGISFHFLHLTFQEYLAALYLVEQISDHLTLTRKSNLPIEQFELYLSNVGSGCNFVICRFICGIIFNEIEHIHLITALQSFIPRVNQVLCHCAFEAKSEVFFNIMVEQDRYCTRTHTFDAYSAYDCAAILHVIANIQEFVRVEISFGNSGVRENQIRALADILARKNGTLQVTELSLSGNKLTNNNVSDLFHRASTSFQSLRILNLERNRIVSDCITVLGKSTFDQLSQLTLSDCPLGISGIQALEDAVCTGSLPRLEWLNLAGSLTSDADVNGALLATSLDTIMSHNLHISHLDLSRNNLGVPGASALARVLCSQCKNDLAPQELDLQLGAGSTKLVCNNLVREIHIDNTNLGDEGLIAFVGSSNYICISHWSLNGNDIHTTGISYLADGVCSGKVILKGILCGLSLNDNPLGLEGAAAVGRMLSSNHCQLQRISLCMCRLTIPSSRLSSTKLDNNVTSTAGSTFGRQLCCMLQNNTIRVLNLNDNSFTGEDIHILIGFMYLCPYLQILNSSHCGITSDDLKQLLDHLTNFKDSSDIPCSSESVDWALNNNQIDDNGAIALMDHLPSLFPSLGSAYSVGLDVNFTGNHVSSEMMRRMREEMIRRKEVIQNYKVCLEHTQSMIRLAYALVCMVRLKA